MQPRNIAILGFKFFGGDAEGCLFIEHPKNLGDTFKMIEAAKAFMKDSGSHWAEMTMQGKDGRQELINLYSEQVAMYRSISDSTVTIPVPSKLELDPYAWAHYD